MMKTWTRQKGFPIVTVQRKGTELLLQQERFFLNMQPEIQASDARYCPSFFPGHLVSTFKYKDFRCLITIILVNPNESFPLWKNFENFQLVS